MLLHLPKKVKEMTAKIEYPSVLIGQLFPNPPLPDGRVYIALTGNLEEVVRIEVRSSAGQFVQSSVHGLPGSGGNVKLDFSECPPGSYDVKITCGTYTAHRQLTVAVPERKWTWRRLFWWT